MIFLDSIANHSTLLVSVGGVAGFFIGASLQTIVEIVYLVFVRS